MLAASAALLSILGLGFALMPGPSNEDDTDTVPPDDTDNAEEPLEVAETDSVALDSLIEEAPTEMEPVAEREVAFLVPEPLVAEETEEADLAEADVQTLSGGPGDTLVGGAQVDEFEVTIGTGDDPETVITNLFDVTETGQNETPEAERVEKIWFKDTEGTLLSRETLLASDMRFEELEDRGGVMVQLNAHPTLFIDDVTLDDITENSLVFGNFQLSENSLI